MAETSQERRRLWASEEETELAFKAIESQRPEDLDLLYAAIIRSGENMEKVVFDLDRPSVLAVLEALPVRPSESDRLKVAFDLFRQMVDDIKRSNGPRSYKNWKVKK